MDQHSFWRSVFLFTQCINTDILPLTHWSLKKMATILQIKISNEFSLKKSLYFDSNVTEVCSNFPLIINSDQDLWCHMASPGHNDLNSCYFWSTWTDREVDCIVFEFLQAQLLALAFCEIPFHMNYFLYNMNQTIMWIFICQWDKNFCPLFS